MGRARRIGQLTVVDTFLNMTDHSAGCETCRRNLERGADLMGCPEYAKLRARYERTRKLESTRVDRS